MLRDLIRRMAYLIRMSLVKKPAFCRKYGMMIYTPKEVFHLAITTFQKDYELIINAFKRN